MLEAEADLLRPAEVEDEGEDVDINQSASKDGHLSMSSRIGGGWCIAGSSENYLFSCYMK